jgi:N-acetylglucosaminyl-diphospho-decaprenol L-rhamnosyltransferase
MSTDGDGESGRAVMDTSLSDDCLMDRLVIVMVLHNSEDELEECLASLPTRAELIVVDNASSDNGISRVTAAWPAAVVVRSDHNIGFGAGCNLGWRAATRPYIAFVNPDVRLRRETLPILVRRLVAERHSIVGPALLNETGVARPCKRRPAPLRDLCGLLPAAGRWAPVGWDGRLKPQDEVNAHGGKVTCVEGACFVMSRCDLELIGGFDEDFFLYYEEESLATRLVGLGGKAIYEPRAVIHHTGATSTAKVDALATRHFHRSRIVFYRKRDGEVRGVLTALLLIIGVLVSTPGAMMNRVLRRRRRSTPRYQCYVLWGLLAGMSADLNHVPYPRVGYATTAAEMPTR